LSNSSKVGASEVGLVIGSTVTRFFLGAEDLHYGYWDDKLEPTIHNLREAQERYCQLLISHFPEGVRDVLDVGCGVGNLGKRIIEHGYRVDGVSPSTLLTRSARRNLGESSHIYEGRFEDVHIDKKYDLVQFSESFHYIDIDVALEKARRCLNPGGHILICDFFKTDAPGKSPLGGGKKLSEFYEKVAKHPLVKVEDIDITEQTAPTIVVRRDMQENLMRPIWDASFYALEANHPWVARFVKWKFRRKLEKFQRKHLGGGSTPEAFRKFKSYRLFVFKTQQV